MKSFEGGVESFVVSGEAAEACCPGEAAFHDPASGQQDEASFGYRMLDPFEPQIVLRSDLGSVRPV